jgi:hypothetical protein
MKIEYDITFDDYVDIQEHLSEKITKKTLKKLYVVNIILVITLLLLCIVLLLTGSYFFAFGLFAGTMVFLGLTIKNIFSREKRLRKILENTFQGKDLRSHFGKRMIELTPEWIFTRSEFSSSRISWKAIIRIDETEKMIYLYEDDISAIGIPKRSFKTNEESNEFVEEARRYRG